MARSLGVEGQGVYAAAGAFSTLWATLWLLGIDAAHTWGLASSRVTLGRALANTLVWIVILSALAVPSYLLAVRFLDPEKVRPLLPVLGITALFIPMILARYLLLANFLGMGEVDRYNILNVVSQVLLLVALLVVLVAGHGGTRAAVIAFGGSILLLVVLAWLWIRRRRLAGDPLRIDREFAGTSLSYGLRGYGTAVFGQLNYRFDQVLVTQFAGVAQQGYYSIAVLLAEKLAHITNSIQLVIFPKVSAVSPEEANTITTTACRHALYWVGAAALVMFLIRRPLVSILYGSAFLPALAPLAWLIPGIFLLTFWKVLAVDLSGRNKRFPTVLASGIAFIANTALNLWWIPRHGILGAAWSSTISYALQSLLLVAVFVRLTGVAPRKLVVPERRDLEIYRRIFRNLRRRSGA